MGLYAYILPFQLLINKELLFDRYQMRKYYYSFYKMVC